MLKYLTCFLSIVFLVSCTMSETRIFSLEVPVEKKAVAGESVASVVILVQAPRYLAQPYIASRNSPYQLMISRYSKWDSPPDEMVRQAVKDTLSSSGLFKEVRASSIVPGGFYSLTIHLKRFERADEGNGSFSELAFDINLSSPDGRDIYQGSITKKVRLEDQSFSSLAKGLSSSLAEGLQEVRVHVEKSLGQ
jgi:uncharacterized lipoprotein YmbA